MKRMFLVTTEQTPRWIAVTTAVLMAWNLGLIAGFFLSLGMLFGFASIHDTVTIRRVGFILGFVLSFTLSGWLAKLLLPWFCSRRQITGFIILILLVVLTLVVLPSPMVYFVGM